jgi:FlaA1/EpsC-like NDP-sugar epimerase
MMLMDAFLVMAAFLTAYFLRFEGQIPQPEWITCVSILPYVVPFKLIIFYGFGLYKGMWRYTSLVDLLT